MTDLPLGWAETTLKMVCSKITDGTHHSPVNLPTGEFMYVTAKNIKRWGLDLSNISFVSAETHNEIYGRCPVEKGDVLYIKDGATTGLAIINPLDEPFSLLSSVALLKPSRDALNADFLKYWLNSPDTLRMMLGQMTGTAIRRLTLTKISSQLIALPPHPEQKRIVSKLDSLTARTTTARTHLTTITKLVEKYKLGFLGLIFENLERPTDDLRELTSLVTSGSRGWAKYYADDGPMFIRVGDTRRGSPVLDLSDVQHVRPPDDGEGKRTKLVAGDLVVSITADLGRVSLIPEGVDEAYVNQHIALVRPKDTGSSSFIAWYLISPPGQVQLFENDRGATKAGLGLDDIRDVMIPRCKPEEQRAIVKKIETAFAMIDCLAAEAKKALRLADRLDQGILAKAFAGELVPQDPNDEPTSELLDRIREARANAPKKPRKKPTKAKSMKVAPKERVLTDSAEWPDQGLPFEDIAKRLTLPHDDLKDAVFALLEGDAPKLRQKFDTDAKVMKLMRVTS